MYCVYPVTLDHLFKDGCTRYSCYTSSDKQDQCRLHFLSAHVFVPLFCETDTNEGKCWERRVVHLRTNNVLKEDLGFKEITQDVKDPPDARRSQTNAL